MSKQNLIIPQTQKNDKKHEDTPVPSPCSSPRLDMHRLQQDFNDSAGFRASGIVEFCLDSRPKNDYNTDPCPAVLYFQIDGSVYNQDAISLTEYVAPGAATRDSQGKKLIGIDMTKIVNADMKDEAFRNTVELIHSYTPDASIDDVVTFVKDKLIGIEEILPRAYVTNGPRPKLVSLVRHSKQIVEALIQDQAPYAVIRVGINESYDPKHVFKTFCEQMAFIVGIITEDFYLRNGNEEHIDEINRNAGQQARYTFSIRAITNADGSVSFRVVQYERREHGRVIVNDNYTDFDTNIIPCYLGYNDNSSMKSLNAARYMYNNDEEIHRIVSSGFNSISNFDFKDENTIVEDYVQVTPDARRVNDQKIFVDKRMYYPVPINGKSIDAILQNYLKQLDIRVNKKFVNGRIRAEFCHGDYTFYYAPQKKKNSEDEKKTNAYYEYLNHVFTDDDNHVMLQDNTLMKDWNEDLCFITPVDRSQYYNYWSTVFQETASKGNVYDIMEHGKDFKAVVPLGQFPDKDKKKSMWRPRPVHRVVSGPFKSAVCLNKFAPSKELNPLQILKYSNRYAIMMSPLVTKAVGVSFSFDDIKRVKTIFSKILNCNDGFKVIGKSLLDRKYLALTAARRSEYDEWCDLFMMYVGQIKDFISALTEASDVSDACNILAHILMCLPLESMFPKIFSYEQAHECYRAGRVKEVVEYEHNEESVDKLYADYKGPLVKCCNSPVPLTDPVARFTELTEEKHMQYVDNVTITANKWYEVYSELYMDTKNKEFNVLKKYILDNLLNYINAVLIASA